MADFDSFSLVVDRESAEKLDYSIIQTYIDKCSVSKDTLIKRQSQLDFSIFGYDDDECQLCEIIDDNIDDELTKTKISQQIMTYYQNWFDSFKKG
jgi:hypothetical protein